MRTIQTAAIGLAFTLGLALPVHAQEEPEAEVVPVDESAPEQQAPAGESPAGGAAPAESAEAPAEEAPAEEAPAEEVAAEETSSEPGEPLGLYVGADWVMTTLSISASGNGTPNELDSGMYRARIGWRALEAVGLEAHVGLDNSDDEPGSVETKSYYGVFVVPTATVFEVMELAFPIGYAQSTYGDDTSDEDFGSIAYGIDAELPLRTFADSLPDLRLTAGWMVYYQKSDARAYGANAGLRYDFQTSAIGNPLAGLGGALKSLWPFGDDDAATETAATE